MAVGATVGSTQSSKRVMALTRRLLGDPRAGGVGGHADDVDPAGGQLQEEQDMDASEDTVSTVKKSHASTAWAWLLRKRLPGWSRSPRRRPGAGSSTLCWRRLDSPDRPAHRGSGDAPARVLRGQ